MQKSALLRRDDSVLIVVDLQQPFLNAVSEGERVLDRSLRLIKAAKILNVPVLATEQYPERMGPTVTPVLEAAEGIAILPKLAFSSARAEGFWEWLNSTGRRTVVLCGVESHVCVNQTAHDLLEAGYAVALARDAVSSRFESDRDAALERLHAAGAQIVTTEMVLFEWLERAGTPEFKAVQALLK